MRDWLISKDAEEMESLLKELTPDERMEVLCKLKSTYCFYCGCDQPQEYRCQCMNDE